MSRRSVKTVLLVALLNALASVAPGAQSKSGDPVAVYEEYLGVLAKASTLDPLLPYFTKELADGLRTMPQDMHANYLKMNKRVVSDLKVTKQTVTATQADLELTGKDAGGQSLTGTAKLVKEGGAWKVEDFTWVGPAAGVMAAARLVPDASFFGRLSGRYDTRALTQPEARMTTAATAAEFPARVAGQDTRIIETTTFMAGRRACRPRTPDSPIEKAAR